MLVESLLGGVLGAVARMAPEILKFFDRNNDRKHEYKMYELQTKFEQMKGEFKVEEKYVDFSVAQMSALETAYQQQAIADSRASQWVANLSAMVRPGITYVIFGMYVLFKLTMMYAGISTGQPWVVVLGSFNEADMAMLNSIIGFWFISRSIEKYRNN